MHISKKEAEAEAMQIADAFVAANCPEESPWRWTCLGARPDIISSGYKRRKTVIKWSVTVQWIPMDGSVMDGPSIVCVNIESKEARWMELL